MEVCRIWLDREWLAACRQLILNLRNLGIMVALMILGCSIYLLATEYITEQKPKGEILLFQRGGIPRNRPQDEESVCNGNFETTSVVVAEPTCKGRVDITFRPEQESVFHWEDVSFDIGTKDKTKRILQGVDGWIRPGSLTALMVRIACLFCFSNC